MKLSLIVPKYYRVKRGQTVFTIAKTFSIPPKLLVLANDLHEEVEEGQVIKIPKAEGNLYVVQGGESKSMLCGSPENFLKLNGTACFYIGQTVLI